MDPHYLELEFTENSLIDVSKRNLSVLKALRKLGVQLSIDDFGSGYSSFSYLKQFKIDIIKIDQSFISNLLYKKDTKIIISAMISMAHTLNIKVVAEGVEDLAQLALLKEMGCDTYQGFLFSKPLTADEIELLVRSLLP